MVKQKWRQGRSTPGNSYRCYKNDSRISMLKAFCTYIFFYGIVGRGLMSTSHCDSCHSNFGQQQESYQTQQLQGLAFVGLRGLCRHRLMFSLNQWQRFIPLHLNPSSCDQHKSELVRQTDLPRHQMCFSKCHSSIGHS